MKPNHIKFSCILILSHFPFDCSLIPLFNCHIDWLLTVITCNKDNFQACTRNARILEQLDCVSSSS